MVYRTLGMILIYALSFFPLHAFCASLLEDELRQKCAKRSGEWFEMRHGSGYSLTKGVMIMSHYRNHYNRKRDKCFILVRTDYFDTNRMGESFKTAFLGEVNDNLPYGSLLLTGAKSEGILSGQACGSEKEWESLARPYMEE